ncbi:hypothetical protein AMS68_002399 [Peltaster fructicola]|uniref:F-box domain-containing protein n=1 Tax=Peltaster fructicola TaxID=286661 RepID=A0A6H0XQ39_9PEZI|nr:hypothetical protein AMS68_002399 [Peltaster fructicola]
MDSGVSSISWQSRFVTRMGKVIRSDKHYTNEVAEKRTQRERGKLRKRSQPATGEPDRQHGINELGEREYLVFSEASTLVEPAVQDHTDIVHQLSMIDDNDHKYVAKRKTALDLVYTMAQLQHFDKQALLVEQVPDKTWRYIASLLDPASAAFLALSNRSLYRKIGFETMWQLNQPSAQHCKNEVLHYFDRMYPDHLLCFHCTRYHRRIQPGKEMLKINHVMSPIVVCPRVKSSVLPRIRLTHGRELPYAFVQLALREYNHSKGHGISASALERHWKCKDSPWSHRSRYMVINGRLAVRIRSQCFAAPDLTETARRHLLFDREEYTPFFSVCPHWRDGLLMDVCKCMLSHVPRPPKSYLQQLKEKPGVSRADTRANFIISGCDFCRPARRCTECPSEYLVEIQMVEDTNDPVQRFKHAIVVTRWTDLGDGSSPFTSPEWVAISTDKKEAGAEEYDSFTNVGRRAIAGSFESAISGTVPGQRLASLNPKQAKRGENDHGWY